MPVIRTTVARSDVDVDVRADRLAEMKRGEL